MIAVEPFLLTTPTFTRLILWRAILSRRLPLCIALVCNDAFMVVLFFWTMTSYFYFSSCFSDYSFAPTSPNMSLGSDLSSFEHFFLLKISFPAYSFFVDHDKLSPTKFSHPRFPPGRHRHLSTRPSLAIAFQCQSALLKTRFWCASVTP